MDITGEITAECSCRLQPNSKDGKWPIGNQMYAPTDIRGQPSQEIAELMFNIGVIEGKNYFQRTKNLPEYIKITNEGAVLHVRFPKTDALDELLCQI